MSSAALQTYYLQQMGIEIWQLRASDIASKKLCIITAMPLKTSSDLGTGAWFLDDINKFFDHILTAVGLTASDVAWLHYNPAIEDDLAMRRLVDDINTIGPTCIVLLGEALGQKVLRLTQDFEILRETLHHFQHLPVFLTYEPSYLLEQPSAKKQAYHDWLKVKRSLSAS